MAKVKYYFNPKNLTYEKYKPDFWTRLLRFLGFVSSSLLFSFIIVLILFFFFDSPKEKQLKRELSQFKVQYELMNDKLDQLSQVVKDLENRDQKIYRVIFEAEPIPESIRTAGYGGVERYNSLEGMRNAELVIQSAKKLDKLSKKLYVLSNSYDEIAKLAENKKEMLSSIPAIQPVKNKDLTRLASGYGYRIHPIYKTVKFHEGIDFSAPRGTEVFATGDGIIEDAEYSRRGYGNRIIIDHGFGYKTMYCHLSKFSVKRGQKIKRGELIGEVGSSGLSTAPHLHYEVLKNGKKINPINFFHNDLSPLEYQKVLELANPANQSFD